MALHGAGSGSSAAASRLGQRAARYLDAMRPGPDLASKAFVRTGQAPAPDPAPSPDQAPPPEPPADLALPVRPLCDIAFEAVAGHWVAPKQRVVVVEYRGLHIVDVASTASGTTRRRQSDHVPPPRVSPSQPSPDPLPDQPGDAPAVAVAAPIVGKPGTETPISASPDGESVASRPTESDAALDPVPHARPLDAGPSGRLAALVEQMSLADACDGETIAVIRATQRLIGWAAAKQLRAVAELHARRTGPTEDRLRHALLTADTSKVGAASRQADITDRAVGDEIALELSCSRWLAERLVDTALALTGELPATLDALESGTLDPRKAETIALGIVEVGDPAVRSRVEADALSVAGQVNVPTLRERIKQAVLRAQPVEAAEAARRARAQRRVVFTPAADDMLELWALLPADDGMRLRTCLDLTADRATHPGDSRTADQRRLDALVDSVIGSLDVGPRAAADAAADRTTDQTTDQTPDQTTDQTTDQTNDRATDRANAAAESRPSRRRSPSRAGPKHQVTLTVSLATVLGAAEDPGHLDRYGPVGAELARRMAWDVARQGTWRCAVTDDRHGTLLGLGTSTHTPEYAPTAALVRHLVARDRFCRFPGCRAPAGRADTDHCEPHPGGPTCECNTESLCGHHHRVKHETRFSVRLSTRPDHPPGTLIWTTPGGREYPDFPATVGSPRSAPARTSPPADPGPPPF